MSRFQILALDGGGLRGMFSAALLAKFEEKHRINIVDHFDLIRGTSTGGLIALGLGLGLRPREILKFYADSGPKIFPGSNGIRRRLRHWFKCKYDAAPLHAELQKPDVFGDCKLGDCRSRLVIPTYDLAHDQVRIFKTPHHERLRTDWSIPVWKVAAATSAAPTFFPACREVQDCRLVDGGMWANNPAVVGIGEAVSMFGQPLSDIHVLSLGTTVEQVDRRRGLDRGGIVAWIRNQDVIDILMRGQSVGATGLAGHLIGPDHLLRIHPTVPKAVALDRPDADRLLALAEREAVNQGPGVEDQFFSHSASPYKPCYPSLAPDAQP